MMKRNKIIILIVILALAVMTVRWQTNNLKNAFFAITSPSQKFLWAQGAKISNFFQALWFSQSLKLENNSLKQEIIALQQQLVELKQQQQESLDLKAALGWQTEKKWQLEAVDILSKELNRDTLIINKGQVYGLAVGMPVITSQGALAGRVSEVLANFAKVMLISNTESSFNIEIQTGQNPTGIVKGQGGFQVSFDYIPKEEQQIGRAHV